MNRFVTCQVLNMRKTSIDLLIICLYN